MRERITARVILLDGEGRILMMKGRLPSDPGAPGAWFTVGGGAEAGETVLQAAAREIVEETGFTDARLGPVVACGEGVFHDGEGRPALIQSTYFVAWCGGGEISRQGWQPLEHELVDDIRWWTLAELAVCPDDVYPLELIGMLPDLIAGRFPDPPVTIRHRDTATPA